MKVSDAILSRFSARAFLNKPVEGEVLREILEIAKRSPSGGNLQPWRVWVLGGAELARFRAMMKEKLEASPLGEGSEYNIYPPNLKEPYRTRRFQCGEDLYATIHVPREDRAGRLQQFARNFDFFGAPVALFFAIDRDMEEGQWADLGMFMQSIMLLAREKGLHTCAQEAWSIWYKTIGEFLSIPSELMLFCGMSLGYLDESESINTLRTRRAALDEFATFVGI